MNVSIFYFCFDKIFWPKLFVIEFMDLALQVYLLLPEELRLLKELLNSVVPVGLLLPEELIALKESLALTVPMRLLLQEWLMMGELTSENLIF